MTETNEVEEIEETEGTLEEQIEKMQSALDKYKKENEKFRQQRDEWKDKFENDVASNDLVNELKSNLAKSEAKFKLQSEGVKDAERFIQRMDLSGVTVDDSGVIDGVDEQISAFKTDFPEVFDSKRRVGGAADGSSRGSTPSLTPTEAAVRKLFNK